MLLDVADYMDEPGDMTETPPPTSRSAPSRADSIREALAPHLVPDAQCTADGLGRIGTNGDGEGDQ